VQPEDERRAVSGPDVRAGTSTGAGAPSAQPPTAAPEEASPGPIPAAAVSPPVSGTRTGATWAALACGLFLLIVILVFILQNLRSVKVHFFWADWSVPLAVDLLLAAVLGAMVMFTVGALRILQLRRTVRRATVMADSAASRAGSPFD
jgi:uncharacterized integral membrane protein